MILDLKKSFTSVCSYKLHEDINEIVYCQNVSDSVDVKEKMKKSGNQFNVLSKNNKLDSLDVEEFMNELKI